jgi:isochorismate synthase EntC
VPSQPVIRRLKHLLHLSTPIGALLRDDTHAVDLLCALHPTPAVGGAPTDRALEWIEQNEAFDRGWYSGAVGWFDARGDGDFNVALRSGLLRDNRAWLYAGAGIVQDSASAAEYQETTLKLAALLGSLRSRS